MESSNVPDLITTSQKENINTAGSNTHVKIIDYDKNTKLHYAAAAGLIEDVTNEVQKQTKIDIENYLGWTPLMMACRRGHYEVVKYLLENRADATRKNKYGYSVFLVSVASGKLEIIDLVLQHLLCGGVSRQSMESIFSPISLAILYNDKKIVEYLLEKCFNINAATPTTGITPLMFATAMEKIDLYNYLISKKADATLKNYLGLSVKDINDTKNHKPSSNLKTNPIPSYQIPQPISQLPLIVISPQPNYFPLTPNHIVHLPAHYNRKSSNVFSPNYYFTPPNVTPIAPMPMVSQVFFPQEFASNPILNHAVQPFYNTNDFLNNRFNQGNFSYVSPATTPHGFASPCV